MVVLLCCAAKLQHKCSLTLPPQKKTKKIFGEKMRNYDLTHKYSKKIGLNSIRITRIIQTVLNVSVRMKKGGILLAEHKTLTFI